MLEGQAELRSFLLIAPAAAGTAAEAELHRSDDGDDMIAVEGGGQCEVETRKKQLLRRRHFGCRKSECGSFECSCCCLRLDMMDGVGGRPLLRRSALDEPVLPIEFLVNDGRTTTIIFGDVRG